MEILTSLFSILVMILIFLLFRSIVLWYWRLNEIAELLKQIEKNTRKEIRTEK